jgi:hypothetical protein
VREKYCWLVADKPSEQPLQCGQMMLWRDTYRTIPNMLHETQKEYTGRNIKKYFF